jgi:hypothetical protein
VTKPLSLTEPQLKILLSSIGSRPIEGLIRFNDAGVGVGLRRASWEKAVGNLRQLGLVKPYVHGDFEITDEGRLTRDAVLAGRISEACSEIVEWRRTGVLTGKALREVAADRFAGFGDDALRQAEAYIMLEATRIVASVGSLPTKWSVDPARVQG